VEYFFEHVSEATKGKRPLRMQMASGTGKTYVYGMIICRDLRAHPDGQHVIFVPWRDLAWQTAADLKLFGLRVHVIGDGVRGMPDDTNVVVCIYASACRLQGANFRIKIVDEAHHMGNAAMANSHANLIRNNICAQMEADFTATFHDQRNIDFTYDHDVASEQGYVSDFQITAAFLSSVENIAHIATLVAQHCPEWAPMLMVFNRRARAERCAAELAQRGVAAQYIDGKATRNTRVAVKEALRSGTLKVVCVVGLFNEGTSINELRTVFFADMRQSQVNLKQTAMRVTRKHADKSMGNLVVPLVDDEGAEEDLRVLVRSLSAMSPRLKHRIRERKTDWFRCVKVDHASDMATGSSSGSCSSGNQKLFMLRMFDRFGKCLESSASSSFANHVEELRVWIRQHQKLPLQNSSDPLEGPLAAWMQHLRSKMRSLSEGQLVKLRGVSPLVEQWVKDCLDFAAQCRSLKQWKDHFRRTKAWVAAHNGELPRQGAADEEERDLANWLNMLQKLHRKGDLHEPLLEELRNLGDAMLRRLRSWGDQGSWRKAVRAWVGQHGSLPIQESSDPDESALASWLAVQQTHLRQGLLSLVEVAELRQLPGMAPYASVRPPHRGRVKWETRCDDLHQWVQSHGGVLPRRETSDLKELSLALWFQRVEGKYRQQKLLAEQEKLLRRVLAVAEQSSAEPAAS